VASAPVPGAGAFDVVVNASASSLAGAEVPVAASVLKPGALAVDMMYGPAAAGFLAWAREHGAAHLELDSAFTRVDAHRFYERTEPSWDARSFGWVL